jgi:hypothetical protein
MKSVVRIDSTTSVSSPTVKQLPIRVVQGRYPRSGRAAIWRCIRGGKVQARLVAAPSLVSGERKIS